jgi:hydroxylamine dehydrogenase
MGFDHPQWEMYSSSKHGVLGELKDLKVLPAAAARLPHCRKATMKYAGVGIGVRLPVPQGR